MKPFLNQRLTEQLKQADRVFLCTHISPDGDAIGSLLALRLLLTGMGKAVTACCPDPVPKALRPLPGATDVVTPDQVSGPFDAALSVDAADRGRIGSSIAIYDGAPVRLQIDHHGTNPLYADENEVDGDAAAAGCVVMRLLRALGQPLTKDIAACLYTAISTDTGNFSFPNTNAEVFEIMGELMETGFDLAFWARQNHLMRERGHLGLLSRALSRLEYLYDGQVTVTTLLPRDYTEADALPEHSDSIVNYGLYIPGVRLTCFINSQTDQVTKLSFRALPPYSARRVALALGGGGHEAAAATTLRLPVPEARAAALQAIDEEMKCHS